MALGWPCGHERKRPIGVGFFFALGHSSVAIVAATAIALTAGGDQSHFPGLIESGSAVGTAISASFLLAIAAVNAAVLVGLYRLSRRPEEGDRGQQQLDAMLGSPPSREIVNPVTRRAPD